jgi:hypothetical protein
MIKPLYKKKWPHGSQPARGHMFARRQAMIILINNDYGLKLSLLPCPMTLQWQAHSSRAHTTNYVTPEFDTPLLQNN